MDNDNENHIEEKLAEAKSEISSTTRKKEYFSYFLYVFSQFIWTIQGLQLKSFYSLYSSVYEINSFVFWRHLAVSITGYIFIKYKKINFKYPSLIQYKTWFYIRNVGIYICIYTWMQVLGVFRLSTCQILGGLCPMFTILYSIIFLKEKFHAIYAIGIIICFIGSAMIILNERKPETEESNTDIESNSERIWIGIISLIINVNLFALGNVGQKFLCNEKLTAEEQSFYFGFYTVFISGAFCLWNLNFGQSNLGYVLYSLLNGVIFYFCYYVTTISFSGILDISKLQPISYLSTILIVLSGTIIFHESLYFTDILGASMIVGFIIYNGMHPVKSK